MERKIKSQFILGVSLIALFVIYTFSLTVADRQAIGPDGSFVGYASINKPIHELFGVHMSLYFITDWAGMAAILLALGFAVLGVVQLIKRKSIFLLDSSILLLGVFYIIVFGTYLLFEFVVINRRPILINGFLEASYPSSTTVLTMCVLPTAMMQFKRLIKNTKIRLVVNKICALFTAFTVIGRLICGVHWFTDILGGAIFSVAMVLLYSCTDTYLCLRKNQDDRL